MTFKLLILLFAALINVEGFYLATYMLNQKDDLLAFCGVLVIWVLISLNCGLFYLLTRRHS